MPPGEASFFKTNAFLGRAAKSGVNVGRKGIENGTPAGPNRMSKKQKNPSAPGRTFLPVLGGAPEDADCYFGGAGVNPSRLWLGSGLGLGFGAFFASFLPLSLLPMGASVTQEGRERKDKNRTAHQL